MIMAWPASVKLVRWSPEPRPQSFPELALFLGNGGAPARRPYDIGKLIPGAVTSNAGTNGDQRARGARSAFAGNADLPLLSARFVLV
jgi:hypothetical protein